MFFSSVLFFWLLFAVVIGEIAHRKGLSGFTFFVFSLLATPLISGIVVLVARPKLAKIEQQKVKSGLNNSVDSAGRVDQG
jgi:hypothetical protein